MEKVTRTWSVTLADGTAVENLTLNAGSNNFHSSTEITPEMFEGRLTEVHISSSDGDMSDCGYPPVLSNAELVQITPASETQDGQWHFVLREVPEDELFKARTQAQLDFLALSADINLEDM